MSSSQQEEAASSASLTPAEAARLAAERRLAQPNPNAHTTSATSHSKDFDEQSFDPSRQDQLPFFRLLDSSILPNCSKPQAVKTLEMLATVKAYASTLLMVANLNEVSLFHSNILNPPNPAASGKYRQLRMTNSQVKTNIVDVKGAVDYLIQAGFRKTTDDFVPYLTFPSSPSASTLHSLRVANHVLKIVLTRAREAADRQERYRASEQEVEKNRKEKALLGFEEDRRLRKEKDDRDRIVREAKAQKAKEEASTASQQPQGDDNDEAGSDYPAEPPQYNDVVGGGRVLGTGEVVEARMPANFGVDNQDLEDSDYDD
ncbi:hypothetical protein ACM66B_004806 [Microbotryomycetes sp. NB124-2]